MTKPVIPEAARARRRRGRWPERQCRSIASVLERQGYSTMPAILYAVADEIGELRKRAAAARRQTVGRRHP